MKLTYRKSGGIAGLIRGCDLDSNEMSPEEAERLLRWLESSKVLEPSPGHVPKPDAFQYRIAVTDAKGMRERTFGGADVKPEMQALLQYLDSRSRPMRP